MLDIDTVTIVDAWDHIPPAWQELLGRLKRCGVTLKLGGAGVRPAVRASYHLLTAADEWEAAEAVATWLAAGTAEENEQVTLLCSGASAVLDAALRERGLPVVANASASARRGALQLLPLLFENAWRPVDVYRLAELLALEYSSVPRGAARRLLRALTEEPGIGGRAWNAALEKIAAERSEAEAAEFHRLLAGERFDPTEGISARAVAERCRLIIDRLAPRMEEDATAATAVGHARVLSALCVGSGGEGGDGGGDGGSGGGGGGGRAGSGGERESGGGRRIPRTTLERMIDSVIGAGAPPHDEEREASPWRVATHPGEIIDPSATVIWWNFTDHGVPPAPHWSAAERQALAAEGVHLPQAETAHLREAAAWRRPSEAATEQLVMVCPERALGEATTPHPWLDELTAAGQHYPTLQTQSAGELFRGPELVFAGRRAGLAEAARREPPQGNGRYTVGPNAIARPAALSYSSIGDLLGCPMRWTLSRHAEIAASSAAEIPSGNKMLGTFCHRIVELMYADGPGRIEPEEAARQAEALFDSGVEAMASELLLPGREIERRRTRRMVALAVRRLAEALERAGLSVEATEEFLEVDLDGTTLRGPADIIARDSGGRAFIIDLKWSNSSRYRREEIARGEALQLAVYSWMLRRREAEKREHGAAQRGAKAGAAADMPDSGTTGSAYFMLAQGELLSANPLLKGETVESELSEEEIFDRALRGCEERLTEMNRGVIEATGVTEAIRRDEEETSEDKLRERLRAAQRERGLLYQKPPCRFCDYKWLCGLEGDTV